MPRVSETFPSKTLSAADLDEQDYTVTITDVDVVQFDDGTKYEITLKEDKKHFICNKTNANTIARMYGDDTDDWLGKQITLYPAWVDVRGEQKEAIRVRPKPPKAKPARKVQPVSQQEADMDPDEWEVHGQR